MSILKTIFICAICAAGGASLGWLTVNAEWFRILSAIIVSVISGSAFSIWITIKLD